MTNQDLPLKTHVTIGEKTYEISISAVITSYGRMIAVIKAKRISI
jgi:hypothetical protein